jgi:hypothetical protein
MINSFQDAYFIAAHFVRVPDCHSMGNLRRGPPSRCLLCTSCRAVILIINSPMDTLCAS